MSDHFTILIPDDPRFVPTTKAQGDAVVVLWKLSPEADDITSGVDEGVVFRDCGGNFESVACPKCRGKIDLGTWQSWMDEDYAESSGFRLGDFVTPCCSAQVRLSDLLYDWPQGFSRYYLIARNPDRPLSEASVGELERVLGCKLRVIRQHL
jgi:hypothetical protein